MKERNHSEANTTNTQSKKKNGLPDARNTQRSAWSLEPLGKLLLNPDKSTLPVPKMTETGVYRRTDPQKCRSLR